MSDRRTDGIETEPRAGAGMHVDAESGESRVPRALDRLFRTALFIIPIGVAGNVALSLLVTERSLLTAIGQFPRGYLALALVLGAVPWLTNTLRLLIWTRFLGHPMSARSALRIVLATDLGAAVSPTAVGGGFFKWGMLVQRGVSPGAAASLSTLTPLEDGLFFALALPVAVILTASWGNPVFGTIAGELSARGIPLVGTTAAIALLTWATVRWTLGGRFGRTARIRSQRFFDRIRRGLRTTLREATDVYRLIRIDGKLLFTLSLSLTAIQWIARYSVISCLVAFLGVPVQPVLFWLLQWVVFTLAALIPTPGAAGGAEAAFFIIYSPFLPPEVIALATAGWRFFTFYLLLGIAALGYFALSLRR